ncbi:AAA family ATPase [Thalassospira sp.]|uniref:AAA family ATPase n=1 Tax=Thalassospira sp. TaxID=1912094 RepID=UPI003AA9686F
MQSFEIGQDVRKFADIHMPSDAEEPILAGPVRAAVHEWMTEIWAAGDLEDVGIAPRRSAILYGPPGCGKTTLAHHFAARLGLPLVSINMDSLVSSHLGGTGNNIAKLFKALEGREREYVLFMDEFDAVATKRTSDNQASAREMNATVNSLLRRIEAFKGTAIAATNRNEAIDPAVWRRFGLHLDVKLPGWNERFAIARRYLHPFTLPDDDLDVIADVTEYASPALIKQVMEGLKRALVLNARLGRNVDLPGILDGIVASVQPQEGYNKPPLWEGKEAVARFAAIGWPPERAAA